MIKISISWLQWQDYYPLSYIATHNWCWRMFWEIQRNLPVFQIRHMATISFWQAGKSRPWIVTILDFQGPELDKKKVKKMLMLWSSPTTKSGQAPYGFLPAVVRSGQQSKYLVAVQCVANIVKLGLHQCWFSGQQTSKAGKTGKCEVSGQRYALFSKKCVLPSLNTFLNTLLNHFQNYVQGQLICKRKHENWGIHFKGDRTRPPTYMTGVFAWF